MSASQKITQQAIYDELKQVGVKIFLERVEQNYLR